MFRLNYKCIKLNSLKNLSNNNKSLHSLSPRYYYKNDNISKFLCNQSLSPTLKFNNNKLMYLDKKEPYSTSTEKNEKNRNYFIIGLVTVATSLGIGYYILNQSDQKYTRSNDKDVKDSTKKGKKFIKVPANSEKIPKDVPYVLVGGGTSSFSAFRAIKSSDPFAKILIISNENYYPYMRPPLSKEIWFSQEKVSEKSLKFIQWNGKERNLYYEPEEFYVPCESLLESEKGGVSVIRGYEVTQINPRDHTLKLDDGIEIKYKKCLLATGARPQNLPVFENTNADIKEKLTLYRSIDDFLDVQNKVFVDDSKKTIAIIGGGFLGSELACSIAKNKTKNVGIYQIFPESGNLAKVLPEFLSQWLTTKVKNEGVSVIPNSSVEKIELNNQQLKLYLNNGQQIHVDHAIIAVGVEPNTQLAELSGLEVDPNLGGFVVNTELEARADLYAAGDCACFYDTKFGRRRLEHHDHAVVTGRLAGENMANNQKKIYTHQSMFWSDLGPDIGFEAIGIVDSRLPTVSVFAKIDKSNEDPNATSEKSNEFSVNLKESNEKSKETSDKSQETSDKSHEASEKLNKTSEKSNKNLAETSDKLIQSNKANEINNKVDTTIIKLSNRDESEDYNKGIIFYLRDKRVVGLLLWNVFNRIAIARQVLKDDRKFDDLNELAKLFRIFED